MGNGSQMAKGVADLILLTSSFATVPRAVEEGRRIIRNTHRVAKLFVAKTVYSAVILATLGMAPIAYPFLPRQITVASTLTIGVPAFFLALSPSEGPVRREGFIRSLLAFVVPAGVVSALTTISAYLLVRGPLDAGIAEGRTAAVLATTGMGLAIVLEVERGPEGRRVRRWVKAMCASFGAVLVLGIQVPWLRDCFAAVEPAPGTWAVVAACLAAGVAALMARAADPMARADRVRGGLSRIRAEARSAQPGRSTSTGQGAWRAIARASEPCTARSSATRCGATIRRSARLSAAHAQIARAGSPSSSTPAAPGTAATRSSSQRPSSTRTTSGGST